MNNAPNRHLALAAIWLILLVMPFWLPFVGGYTELGTRVVVMALAAMALNFLLGFTGVLSFGHAAYFGLGAYACGMTMRSSQMPARARWRLGVAFNAAFLPRPGGRVGGSAARLPSSRT